MSDEATNPEGHSESGEREAAAGLAPTWRHAFRATASSVVSFLNTPTVLPPGAVSVSAVSNGFHIFYRE